MSEAKLDTKNINMNKIVSVLTRIMRIGLYGYTEVYERHFKVNGENKRHSQETLRSMIEA